MADESNLSEALASSMTMERLREIVGFNVLAIIGIDNGLVAYWHVAELDNSKIASVIRDAADDLEKAT